MTQIEKCMRCGCRMIYPVQGKKNQFECGYCKLKWETPKEKKK